MTNLNKLIADTKGPFDFPETNFVLILVKIESCFIWKGFQNLIEMKFKFISRTYSKYETMFIKILDIALLVWRICWE